MNIGRDWHATYLTDRVVMAAAQRHANTTGDDGYASAATLALTMAPGITSSAAIGARAVLAPGADALDEIEEDQLADASWQGYYSNPGIAPGNHDMAPSMTRRTRLGEKIRPDLICPACCERKGLPEESGVQRQVYRCTEADCRSPLWEYVPPVDDDDYATSFEPYLDDEGQPFDPDSISIEATLIGPGGMVLHLTPSADCRPDQGPFTDMILPPWSCPACDPQGARAAPPDAAHRCPHCDRAWVYGPSSAVGPPLGGPIDPQDPRAVWTPITDPQQRADFAARLASVMGIPGEMLVPDSVTEQAQHGAAVDAAAQVRATTPPDVTAEVRALLNLDPGLSMLEAIRRLAARVASESCQAAAREFDRQIVHGGGWVDAHATPQQALAERREAEAELLEALGRVSAGRVHVGDALTDGLQEARRQQLVTADLPRRDQPRLRPLMRLTNLGRVELRRLQQRVRQGLI